MDSEQTNTEQNGAPPANNSGALFRNRLKRSDRQPDYRGRAVIDGCEYLVSGWIRHHDAQNASEGQYESHSYGRDDVPF